MVGQDGQGSAVRIYTKTGDDGTTGLLGGERVPKDDIRIEAYGTIDELNAVIGLARAHGVDYAADFLLAEVQNDLFAVGSALADVSPQGRFRGAITDQHVERLEASIDKLESELLPLRQFILPGGALPAAQIHLARTVCRRAERWVVKFSRESGAEVPRNLGVYLNRLSDFLFVLARVVNCRAGVPDTPWKGLRDGKASGDCQ
jgi:cob(I)alamin adenosyltransferase